MRREALRRAEAFPYADSLSSVMDSDLYTCRPETIVKEAVREMTRRGISSVIVLGPNDEPLGILTETDIMRRIVARDGINVETTPVNAVMTPAPVTLSPMDNVYKALALLSSRNIKHLPLVSGGKAVGIITLRQLLKLKYPEPLMLIDGIQEAASLTPLREVKKHLPKLAASKLRRGISVSEIVTMISLINQDIQRKALELALEKHGEPPAGFCLFTTGSHGRMENLLTPDQDHGMIIADEAADDQATLEYFMALTSTYSHWLADIGYELCPGYIMCMNPTWRKKLSEWRTQIDYWFGRQIPHLVRYTTLLYDARPLYGQTALFDSMSDYAFKVLAKHHVTLRILHEEEGSHKMPIGLFGRFITERNGSHRGEIDIKRSGLIFVVEGIRILALMHGLRQTSTLKRIRALVQGGHIHANDGEYFEASYQILLHQALKSQVEKALCGHKVDTYINPRDLSTRDKEMLKHAFKSINALKELVSSEFGELVV